MNTTFDTNFIKQITGGDSFKVRDFKENPYKPKYYHIYFNNNIESDDYYKSRKTYQIHSALIDDNKNDEYVRVSGLFEIPENILKFSDTNYQVVYIDEKKCFYVKELSNNNIFQCDEIDIKQIHNSIYGETDISHHITSISRLPNGNIKYEFAPECRFYGKPLYLDIFISYINNSFNVVDTICELKLKKKYI